MLLVVFMSSIVGMAQGSPEIGVNCGRLEIQGYQFCKIQTNDKVIMYMGPLKEVYDGPFFGLIKYECDHEAGFLMSNMDCEKCDFKCSHEEQTVSSVCQTGATQLWSGVFWGIVCFILIGGLVWKKFSRTLTTRLLSNFRKRSNSGHANGSATTVDLDNKPLKEESGEADGLQSSESVSEATGRRRRNSTSPLRSMIALSTNLLFFTTAYGCDVTVVSGSDNVTIFCQDSKCNSQYTKFTVNKGYQICIEDQAGEQVFLEVSDIIWSLRYELKYYTSDYSTNVTIAEGCCELRDESQCSDVENECYGRTLRTFTKLGENKASKENTYYHCAWSTARKCRMSCAHFVERERKGELYGILKNIKKTALFTFTINGKQYSQNISLTSYDLKNYQLDLTNFQLKNIDSLPITVHQWDSPSPLSLLLHEDKYYYVNASVYHDPNEVHGFYVNDDVFGDFQVSLDELSDTFSIPTFRPSKGDGCETMRLLDESMISKFVKQESNFNKPARVLKRKPDSSVVDTFDDIEKDKVTMYIYKNPVPPKFSEKDWDSDPGACDVEFAGSYGCSSCNESAYVVMIARNITKVGRIPFSSNCSFDRHSIKCDYELTELILKDNHHTCSIILPTIKKRLLVNVTYFRKEQINCTTAYYSYGEAAGHLITSKIFFVSYFVTVLLLIVLGSLVIVGLPLVYKPKAHFVVKKGENSDI